MGNCFSSTKDPGLQVGQPAARKGPVTNQKKSKPQRAEMKGQGHKLADSTIAEPTEKLDPREAAKRAAEVRYEQEKGKQGALGRKLEEERKKSTITHLKEKSQNDYDEKNRKDLVYD
jgi:hypothetical protein